MDIGAAEYLPAAEEHLQAAARCHASGVYLTCHYLCGLSVECILRAYRWRIEAGFDGRHVLPALYKAAAYDLIVPEKLVAEMTLNFGMIAERWSNTHRYASPSKLVKHLNDLGATTGIKGDKMKKNSQEMYDAAEFIVGLGVTKWKS